jgi:hypothetical protein
MLNSKLQIAMAVSVLLAGCGGGGDTTQPTGSVLGAQREQPASMVPAATATATSKDTFLRILPNAVNPNLITFQLWNGSAWVNTYVPKKNDGTNVTSIDDLPEGIANSVKDWNKNGHLRIQFDAGTYQLTRTWVWTEASSGIDATHQILLEPRVAGSAVIISGAKAVSGTVSGGTVTAPVGSARPNQLWAENNRATLARTPNAGSYYYVSSAAHGWKNSALDCNNTAQDCVSDKAPGTSTDIDRLAFYADAASLGALQSAKDETNAAVVMMQSWTNTRGRPNTVNANTREVLLDAGQTVGISRKALMDSGNIQRYYVENIASALDAAGEWYVNTAGSLKYKPVAASGSVTLQVPALDTLLRVQGSATGTKPVQWVQFNRLKFYYTNYSEIQPDGTPRNATGDFVDEQAAYRISAAIEVNDARNVELNDNEVAHTGGHGIWLNKRAQINSVTNNDIYDTGAGGVKVGLADYNYLAPAAYDVQRLDTARTGFNTISANRINSTGHVFPGAVGIWIGRSNDNKVLKNLIKDTTHAGISVGWDWSTLPNAMAQNNEISGNFLLNIGQGVLSDLGGIYTLGNQGAQAVGTKIKGNVIKNVLSFTDFGPSGGAGIYQDQGSAWMEVSGNLVDTTNGWGYTSSSFVNSPGNNNKVSNNAFVRVPYLLPAPSLNVTTLAANLGLSNVIGTLSRNVVLPSKGMGLIDANNPAPSSLSLETVGNLVSNQLNTALTTANACVTSGTTWCAVTSSPSYLATTSTTDAYAIQQFNTTAVGSIFTAPVSPTNTKTWSVEGAKLKTSTSAAAFWKESNVASRGKGVGFAAASARLGTWQPKGGWYLWNPQSGTRAIEQGTDGIRALRLGANVQAYVFPEINSGSMQLKARVYIDGTAPVTLLAQRQSPDVNGTFVTLTPGANGVVKVNTNAGEVATLALATGKWYEITLNSTIPGAATPAVTSATGSIKIDALTANASTGEFSSTNVYTGSNFTFSTNWTVLNRFLVMVGDGSGSVRLSSLYINKP